MTEPRAYTVLLADDVAALRKLVRLAIEGSGRFRVVAEASTGIEAIARAREATPDLVLLDLSMPELDGLEALPRVLEASPNSHVVVLSGFNHVRMGPVAKRLGASAYLEKGLDPEALASALLEVLEPGQAQAREGVPPSSGGTSLEIPPIVSPPPDPARPSASSFQVLLVEADSQRVASLAALLRTPALGGFELQTASSVEAAVGKLGGGKVDLVVVDPGQAGSAPEEALIEILTHAATTPVVALLPSRDGERASMCVRLGVEDFLVLDELDADLLARSLRYAMERRRAHEARRLVRDQQGELSRMRDLEATKTQFFNAAAHEIGTPLTPIRLQIARLKKIAEAGSDPEQRHSIDILDRNVRRLAQLNQDILDVARLQAGRLSVDKRPLDLAGLILDVAETFEPMAQAQGLTLSTSCVPGLRVEGDSSRITQVLYNLVNNALKFTPRGGLVSIVGRVAANDCEILVRDTGPGLVPAQIANLFQPFSQVLGAAQPRNLGTGLGLFISRGIVELHGGRIWCESPGPGQGATFAFALPLVVPLTQATRFVHESEEAQTA
ncbi:MAG: sensor histidine kinase [Thermoplasmatota archaeon]